MSKDYVTDPNWQAISGSIANTDKGILDISTNFSSPTKPLLTFDDNDNIVRIVE